LLCFCSMSDILVCNFSRVTQYFNAYFTFQRLLRFSTALFSVLNEDGKIVTTFRSKSLVVSHKLLLVLCKNKLILMHTYTHTHRSSHACIDIYIRYLHSFIHASVHTYIHTCVYTYIRTHILLYVQHSKVVLPVVLHCVFFEVWPDFYNKLDYVYSQYST
jgi:hypothetical protein